jgi:hypothetical protein
MAGPWEQYQSTSGPWEQYGPATVNPNLQRQGLSMENVRSAAETVSQRDPDIDYKTGVPSAAFRAGFSRMSNDSEKAQYLDKTIGKDQWGKDSFGAYFIKPQALTRFGINSIKPVAIDEQVTSRYDVADVAGDAPAVLGGAGMGMAASGMGVVPGMLLSGLGAAGGKAIDEVVKNVQGHQVNTAGGVATDLAKEGGMGMLGEGAVRVAAPVARFALGPGASRMTPEKKALADASREQGFQIRPGSVTDAPILARWEGMVRSIFGDLNAERNKAAAEAGIKRLTPGTPVSAEAAGEAIAKSVRQERTKFGAEMASKYSAIDELVGGRPIIPTAPIKAKAQAILDAMPRTQDGKVVGGGDPLINDIMQMGEATTVAQAQRLRTMLREAAESPDLVPGVSKHDARVLKDSVNEAFNAAKNEPVNVVAAGADDMRAKQAINMLRAADTAYAQGIRKFDNPVVTKITQDASRNGAVDPDMVVDYLIKPDRVVRLRRVKDVVPAAEWEKVKSAHAQDLLSTVMQGTDDPLKTVFNGRAFRDTLEKYGRQTLEEVHGKEWVDQAYRYANGLMLAEKKMSLSGGIVAANVALHPIQNLPKLVWLRAVAKVMEQPGTFKYLTEGMTLGPNTKAGAAAFARVSAQVAANARDETGSATFTLTPPE